MTSGKSYLNWSKEAGRGHLAAVWSWWCYILLTGSVIVRLQFDLLYTFFGRGNHTLLFLICAGLGIGLGLLEFCYLLQERKQEFYYSLPVKKSTIFYTRYLHGLFHGLIPMLCYMLICGIYQSSIDADFMKYSVGYTFYSILAYGIVFILFYHIAILAVCVCGQFVAVLCMVGVILYGMQFFLKSVCLVFMKSLYKTFYRSPLLEMAEQVLVPWKLGQALTGQDIYDRFRLLEIKAEAVLVIAGSVWIVLLFVLIIFVMKYRRTESTGRIFTVVAAGKVTAIILSVLAGTGIGGLLLTVTDIAENAVLPVILILTTAGIMVATVVHFLFDRLLYDRKRTERRKSVGKNLYRLAAECILVAVVVTVLTGRAGAYDSYLPETEEVKSVGFAIAGIDMDAGDYSNMMRERDSYLAEDLMEQYTMKAEGKETGMRWLRMLQAESKTAEMGEKPTKVTICFEKENGRKIYRTYEVSGEALLAFADVYETEEYKQAAYPLLTESEGITKGARFVWDDGVEQQILKLTDAEKAEFLTLYRQDISELTMANLQEAFPSGRLEIGSEIYDRDIQTMIYPSFKNVTAFLKEHGVDTAKEVGDYSIAGLTVWETHSVPIDSVGGVYMHRYETEEELAEWREKLIPEEFCIQPVLRPVDGTYTVEADVTEAESGAVISVDCNVKPDV